MGGSAVIDGRGGAEAPAGDGPDQRSGVDARVPAGSDRRRPGIRVVLALLVLVPLVSTSLLLLSAARSSWAAKDHASTAAGDAATLAVIANARAEMNVVTVPLTAVAYAAQLGVSEPVLDQLLHPAVPFAVQLARATGTIDRVPVLSSTPTLRADVAQLKTLITQVESRSTTFSVVEAFTAKMAADIDTVWYARYDDLQRDIAAWQPPGSFEVHTAALRQIYQGLLAGGQEVGGAIYVLEGIGPANAKQEVIQAAAVFDEARSQFTGYLSTRASAAWHHLQTTDARFAATIQQAVTVALTGAPPPFSGNLSFAGASMAPGLQYLADLDKLVVAGSQDLQETASTQASEASHHLTGEIAFLVLVALVCLGAIVLIGRVLSRPLEALARQARRAHGGDLDLAPLPVRGPREVVTTTAAFNDMTSTLKAIEGKAIALGAEDLSDPSLLTPLPGRTGQALQASIDVLANRIREREVQRKLLHEAATHDGLTGLLNRPAVFEHLTHDVSRRRDAGETVAVLFVDLDGLKPLNDSYGHEVGDSAILATAQALTRATDYCDVVGRLGGDEFLIVLCHNHSCDGEAVVDRIRRSVGECRITVPDGVVPLVASVGVALAQCDHDTDPMTLVRQADEAMYEAKKSARARRERLTPGS